MELNDQYRKNCDFLKLNFSKPKIMHGTSQLLDNEFRQALRSFRCLSEEDEQLFRKIPELGFGIL